MWEMYIMGYEYGLYNKCNILIDDVKFRLL